MALTEPQVSCGTGVMTEVADTVQGRSFQAARASSLYYGRGSDEWVRMTAETLGPPTFPRCHKVGGPFRSISAPELLGAMGGPFRPFRSSPCDGATARRRLCLRTGPASRLYAPPASGAPAKNRLAEIGHPTLLCGTK